MSQYRNQDIYPGMNKKFRLILRDAGVTREMGGAVDSMTVQYVDSLFIDALEAGASDIHLQPEHAGLRKRLRVDGVMHEIDQPFDPESAQSVVARLKLAAGMHIDERREPQDGRIEMEYLGRRLSGRVSTLPSLNGEKIVVRILDPQNVKVDLAKLGMSEQVYQGWKRAVAAPYGMVVVTGPTGSGKTSTLYASLSQLDRLKRNIVTVEDPVEYEFPDNVLQVGVTEKMTFARVMRSFLRQDPDVMMVGEMRDPESLAIGIQAGLTGHLVLTTLHTNNAVETVGRMMDMDAEPYLIASTIVAIMAQRLVRTNCLACRESFRPTEDEMLGLGLPPEHAGKIQFMRGRGCPACRGTGFRGRIGVFELLMATSDMREAIARREPLMELNRIALENGTRSMMEDGVDKIQMGITTPSEVLHAVYSAALE